MSGTSLSAAEAADLGARFDSVLRFAASRNIADIQIKPGQRPLYRRFGQLIFRRDDPTFGVEDLAGITAEWMPSQTRDDYQRIGHATFMVTLVACGRFRVTALQARGAPSLSVRVIAARVLNLRELNMPKLVTAWSMLPHGLVVVSSGPGAGKSATWAGILEHINTASLQPRQIVTLESPIEQTFDDKVAFVQQRELGVDTTDVATGAVAALRQCTDVLAADGVTASDASLLVGAAELPVLVVASLTAGGVVDVLRQLLLAVPDDQRSHLRQRLARRLRGIVHVALLPTADGKGLVPACELLHNQPQVGEILRSDKDVDALQAVVESLAMRGSGMIGLDQAVLELVQAGVVAPEAAVATARDPEGMRKCLAGLRAAPAAMTGVVNFAGTQAAGIGGAVAPESKF